VLAVPTNVQTLTQPLNFYGCENSQLSFAGAAGLLPERRRTDRIRVFLRLAGECHPSAGLGVAWAIAPFSLPVLSSFEKRPDAAQFAAR